MPKRLNEEESRKAAEQEARERERAQREKGKAWREEHPFGWKEAERQQAELNQQYWESQQTEEPVTEPTTEPTAETSQPFGGESSPTFGEPPTGESATPLSGEDLDPENDYYQWLGQHEAAQEQFNRDETHQMGYAATYWQAPERIARWYSAIQATPPGTSLPEWMTPEFQEYIKQAYEYISWRNDYAPPAEWKYLNADDKLLGLLAELPAPPPEFLWPGEERFDPTGGGGQETGPTMEQVMTGEAAWMEMPEEQRAALLADPTFDIQQFDIQIRQQILADPNFNWDALPDWQRWAYEFQSNPLVQKLMATPIVAAGIKMGGTAGGIFGVPGKIAGSVGGGLLAYGLAIVGGEEYNPMGGFDDQPTWAAKTMWVLNSGAQTTEQALGFASQMYAVGTGQTQQPGETRADAWDRFTSDLEAAWAAGNLTWESMQSGTNFIRDISPFFSDDYYTGLQAIKDEYNKGGMEYGEYAQRVKDLWGQVAGPRAAPGQDFILGKEEAVNILPDEMMPPPDKVVGQMEYVVSQYGEYIAEEVAKGRDIDEVKQEAFMWANQFASAFFKDFAFQVILDPLNVLPFVEGKIQTEFIKITSGKDAPLFKGGWEYPSQVTAEWKAAVGQMDAAKVGELPAVSRWLAGFNKQGEMMAGMGPFKGLYPNETYTRTTPQEGMKGWVQRIFTLAPESRARLAMSMAADHLGAIASHLTPNEFDNFFTSMQKMDLEAAKNIAGDVVGSAEFYTVLPMMKGFDLNAIKTSMWDISAENRGLLLRLADVLGKEPSRLVDDLGKPRSAERVFEQLRQFAMKGNDKAAKALLDDMNAGRFTVADLEQIGRTFNGPDALPWHPAQFQAMALDAFRSHAEKWGVDYFKVKPGSFAAQLAKTLKGVQSVLLLGYSPKYIIDNVINGEVTMAASGVYGMMSMKQIDTWTKRFGWSPERMHESALFGDIGGKPKSGAIADAMRSKGVLGGIQNFFQSWSSKATLMPLAGKMEGMQGARAQTVGMKQMWAKVWERGVGFKKMPPVLESALRGADPLLVEHVYRAIEGGINQKEIMDAIGVRQTGARALDFVNNAAAQMGMTRSQAITLLEQAGIMDALDGYLKNADTPEKKAAAFDAVMKRAEEWTAIRKGQEMRNKAEHVANSLSAEGENRMWEVILDNNAYRNDQWISHYMTADEVAAMVEAMPDEFQGQKSLAWLDWYEKEQRAWGKTNADVLANLKGVMQALGLTHPDAQRLLSLLGEEFDTWGRAYDFRMKQYAEHYETWKGKFNTDTIETRMLELEKRGALIDAEFQKAFEIERVKEEQVRDLMVDMVRAKYGDQVAEVTIRAYQQTIDFRAEMTGVLQKHRKDVKNIYGADRRAANRKFYQDDYLYRVIDMRRVWEEGIGDVQKATRGGGLDTATPTRPPMPTPPPTPPHLGTNGEGRVAGEAMAQAAEPVFSDQLSGVSETPPAVKSAGWVWKIASENGMSGLDANGNQVFGAKLDVIKFVKKWGGSEGGHIKRFDDITPALMQKAVDAKAAWTRDQMSLMPKVEQSNVEGLKSESEGLAEPSEASVKAGEEALEKAESGRQEAEGAPKVAENPTYKKAVSKHISELEPAAREALQYELSVMRDLVNQGEAGKRIIEGYGKDRKVLTTPSTYPSWYGPMKRAKKDVLFALDALTRGLDKPENGLYRSLKAIAADLLSSDGRVLAEKWDWAKAWGYEGEVFWKLDRQVTSAVDDFYRAASEGDVRAMDIHRESLAKALADYPQEAKHAAVKIVDDAGNLVDGPETYNQYHERLWNEAEKLYQQGIAEKLNADAELGIRDAEARGEMAMTREVLREQMLETGLPDAQVDVLLEMYDANAKTYGPKYGLTPEEFYNRVYGGITKGGLGELRQVEPVNRRMSSVELNDYARALVRAGEAELRRAVQNEPNPADRVAILEAAHSLDPKMAEEVGKTARLYQENKGAVTMLDDMKGLIHAYEAADFSTFVHEPAHIFLRQLMNFENALPEHQKAIAKDWKAVNDWARLEQKGNTWEAVNGEGKHSIRFEDDLYYYRGSSGEEYVFATFEEAQARLTDEMFARGFEKYIAEGSAPTKALRRVFEMMKDWMVEIYRAITGSQMDVNLTPEIRNVFDRLLAEQPLERVSLDERARIKEVEDFTGTDFFQGLKEQARQMKAQREELIAQQKARTPEEIRADIERMNKMAEEAAAEARMAGEAGSQAYEVKYNEAFARQEAADVVESPFFQKLKEDAARIREGRREGRRGTTGLLSFAEVQKFIGWKLEEIRLLSSQELLNAHAALTRFSTDARAGKLPGDYFAQAEIRVAESGFIQNAETTLRMVQDEITRRGIDTRAETPKPNTLFQKAELPLGGMDQASGFIPEGAILDETFTGQIKPLLEAMKAEAGGTLGDGTLGSGKLGDLPVETQAQLMAYVKKVTRQDMPSAKLAAVRYGEGMRDFSMLNYNKKYGFDKAIEPIIPYQFWMTRTGMNSALRIFDRPAWFANYFRLQRFTSRYERDLPDRLKGKIKIELPFLPEWTGQAMYVDPFRQLFPWVNFAQPFEQLRRDKNAQVFEAERVLQEWAADGSYSEEEIQQAAETQAGAAWDAALAEASLRRKAEIASPLDFMSVMFGPAWYLTMPAKMLGLAIPGINSQGEGPENIGLTQVTRTGMAFETATAGTWAEPIGKLIGLLAKPEQWIREKAGLPQFGEYGEYYIDRQLANLVAEGVVSVDDAKRAMIERSGEAYEMAVERVRMELTLKVPLASAAYAGTHGGLDDLLASLPASILGGGILPEGELRYRGLKEKWNAAWDAYDAGDKDAIGKFFEDHPEYEVYLMKGQTPDDRLRNMLVSQIWDAYMGLDKATRRIVTAQMGPEFEHAFLNSETRSPESLSIETLARWSMMLGNEVPTPPPTPPQTSTFGEGSDVPVLEGLPTGARTALGDYEAAKAEMFPYMYELQDLYFSSSDKDRARIITIYPQIKEYWEWRRQYIEEHPEAAPFLDKDVAAGIISGELNAWDYGMSPEQAERLIGYYNNEFATPVYTADYYLQNATPFLMQSLSAHQLMGSPLTEGAYKELRLIWEGYGKPGESFEDWLENVIYATSGW